MAGVASIVAFSQIRSGMLAPCVVSTCAMSAPDFQRLASVTFEKISAFATVTICGFIKEGTHFDPDQIADAYVKLHRQQPGQWEREIMFT